MSIYEELIKYSPNFSKEKNAFYGPNSPLDEKSQKEYLKTYAEYAKKRYGSDVMFKKAVTDAEIDKAYASFTLDKGATFKAYKRDKIGEYKNWQLYTKRAVAIDGVISLNEDYTFPLPAAKYLVKDKPEELTFEVYIDKSYYCYFPKVDVVTTAKYVDFRSNCDEIIKIGFAPNGTVFYKDSSKQFFHYETTEFAKYEFDKWNKFTLKFNEKDFDLEFGGKTYTFNYSANKDFDNIYIGGGMQPAKGWKVKLVSMKTKKGETTNFFTKNTKKASSEEFIEEKALPIVIGTKVNQDKELVLRRTFEYTLGNKCMLKVGAIDPGGIVYVNGTAVIEKDEFQPFILDITEFVKEGENDLEIVVNPRAPEVLYSWHRHNDFYNGWFCLSANVILVPQYGLKDLVITTIKVGEKSKFIIKAKVVNDEFNGKEFNIYLSKIHPDKKGRVLIKKGVIKGDINETIKREVDIWDIDNPNLYNVEIEVLDNGKVISSIKDETGFRTIAQRNGGIYLNDKKVVIKGALSMQFLPPYDNVPVNHVCPSDKEIVMQVLQIKAMNGNTLRMHQLGYGIGDRRFSKICDRLGIMLLWTTRLIDSNENVQWAKDWKQRKDYQKQMLEVINSPSIIMWEGANEFHASHEELDALYDTFVKTVREIDESRILCPVSHIYYGGGLYSGFNYYTNDGKKDELGAKKKSSFGWMDKDVIRSSHTYCLLLGYGEAWERMVEQDWQWQNELFKDKKRAYAVTEFAVIGRQNPETPEAKEFINKASYELPDEQAALGYMFTDDEWELSQAFQAMCASVDCKQLVKNDVDGMTWCCLQSGANNASYLKPIIDFYGYTKLAFYSLKEAFQSALCFNYKPDVLVYDDYKIEPMVKATDKKAKFNATVSVYDLEDNLIVKKEYFNVKDGDKLSAISPNFDKEGYYYVRYEVNEIK